MPENSMLSFPVFSSNFLHFPHLHFQFNSLKEEKKNSCHAEITKGNRIPPKEFTKFEFYSFTHPETPHHLYHSMQMPT